MARNIKVLIIDDSALMRQMLTAILHEDPQFQVVGAAADPFIAREKIKALRPDVLTLDVEMPRMDGLTFLENLMRLHPLPVVMISSVTEKGASATLRALELGAVDFVMKPQVDLRERLGEIGEEIRAKVKAAAEARLRPHVGIDRASPVDFQISATTVVNSGILNERIIVLGASTGGTQAIREVLECLPLEVPGIAIVQHMPSGTFTAAFAERLNGTCQLEVREARDGELLAPGLALVAPGGQHLTVVKTGLGYQVKTSLSDLVNRHRPSVDVLFNSAAKCAGKNALGILLTGMGSDGALGLRKLKDEGAHTFAQDEKSCVVYGMPKEAVRHGAVSELLPLDRIAGRIVSWAWSNARKCEIRRK